jgi:hypothetical protein
MSDAKEVFSLIGVIVIALALIVVPVMDAKRHGTPTGQDRSRALAVGAAGAILLTLLFYGYPEAYAVIVAVVIGFVFLGVWGVGTGKRGLWRQYRDGTFLAVLLSMPLCFLVYVYAET